MKISDQSIIEVNWNVLPVDYTKEMEKNIKVKCAKKYGVPESNVKVNPNFIMINENGEKIALTNDTIVNIQDPKFQVKIFKQYLEINNVENFDWEYIKSIDAEINSEIDYNVYDKYKKYSLKWIKWSNFLSYGKDNYFDFTKLKGMVLVNGKPSNQSGKTTFSIELLRFLLFGKTSKFKTLEGNFNVNLPEETEMTVEGQIEIDGENFIIKRTVSRPSLKKRSSKSKVQQKVEYYKVLDNGDTEELYDVIENCQEESGLKTNIAIKEAIGNEQDFDLVICATNENLRDLINFKETERGRLLSRWIGLLPIEEKERIAKEKYKLRSSKFISNVYNRETLDGEINDYSVLIENITKECNEKNTLLKNITNSIASYREELNKLLESKKEVDNSLISFDINSHLNEIERIKTEGIRHKAKKEQDLEMLKEIPENVDYSEEIYKKKIEERALLKSEIASLKRDIERLKKEIATLESSEYCPTCHRKYDNVDNSTIIKAKKDEIDEIILTGKVNREKLDKIEIEILEIEKNKELYDKKNKLDIEIKSLNLLMDNLRNKLINANTQTKLYQKNKDSIDFNNNIKIKINNLNARIETEEKSKDNILKEIHEMQATIVSYTNEIKRRKDFIDKIKEEETVKRNWGIYLDMVGKNGITKMILRNTLPIINAELKRLLTDICNFDVEISINERNEVSFSYSKDGGPKVNISGTSGLEETISSLALRAVLANISTMPKLNFVVLDELWGCVADDNLSKLKPFIDRILSSYDFILQVSHNPLIADWHDSVITVYQDSNVSKISF